MERPAPFALRYYAYRAASAVGWTAPIWYLYLFENGLSYAEVALVNAVWWGGLVVFELPTGYVADRIGRRESLLVGTGGTVLATLAMVPASSPAAFAVVFAAWALAQTFRTGADDAWLYDALADDARAGDTVDGSETDAPEDGAFVRLRGRGNAVSLVVTGATALGGGWLAAIDMDYTFLAAAATTSLALPAVYGFPRAGDAGERFTVVDAVPVLREEFGAPPVRAFVLLVALLTGVHWGINFFVQPVSVDLGFSTGDLGVLYATFTGLGAVVSYRSDWLADRVGIDTWFRTIPVGLGALFLAVVAVPALAIPAFVATRVVRSASTPLAAQWINERIGSVGRATVLSAAGMVYTTLTIPFELGAGGLASVLGPMRTIGLFGGVLIAGSLLLVAIGRPFAGGGESATSGEPVPESTASDSEPAADPDAGGQPE